MITNPYFDVLKRKEELEKEDAKKGLCLTNIILANNLRTTSTYKECQSLYKEYIYRIADFISCTYSVVNSLEATILVDYLLWEGFFSANNEHKYQEFTYEEELLPELLGTKSVTGAALCRHMASFVATVLNLEYSASFVAVKIVQNGSFYQIMEDVLEPVYNHAVVGVVYKDGKFIYDPTNRMLAHKFVNRKLALEENRFASVFGAIPFPCQRLSTGSMYVQSQDNFCAYKAFPDEFYSGKIVNAPLVFLENEDLQSLVSETAKMYIKSRQEREEFKESTRKLEKRIAILSENLMPRSDEPIKKWLVKR